MSKLLRHIRGYLCIKVSGYKVERFINLCGNHNILLWNIRECSETYYMNIGLKSFWLIRPIVKKSGVKVVVSERYGLPFYLYKSRKRNVFFFRDYIMFRVMDTINILYLGN